MSRGNDDLAGGRRCIAVSTGSRESVGVYIRELLEYIISGVVKNFWMERHKLGVQVGSVQFSLDFGSYM